MSKRTASAQIQSNKSMVSTIAWIVLVLAVCFSFKMYMRGLTIDHPRTFDEHQYVWLAHHLTQKPDDYSTRELLQSIYDSGGNIGVIGNGAGLNMATLDIISHFGGKPANFLEVSGRTYHKSEEAIDIVLSNPNVKAIFGNFFGCISRCDNPRPGLKSCPGWN